MIATVFIANTAEAFESLLQRTTHTEEGTRRMRHEFALSQRAFFWNGDDKVVITPYPIPEVLVRHNLAVCGFSNVVNFSPQEAAIALSGAIATDDVLMNAIAEYARNNPDMKVSPYAVTVGFLSLIDRMRQMGISSVVDESPLARSVWTVRYLDSKVGFRAEMQKLMAQHPEIQIPEGFVAENQRDAISMAKWFYAQGRSIAVKANYGESGWGLMLLKAEEYADASALRGALERTFASDPVWEDMLIVIEELIEPDTEIAGGSPSSELFVNEEQVVITYHCGQLLDEQGGFFGVELGNETLPDSLRNTLDRIAMIIGQRYQALGYRGFFDIDYVVAKNGTIYVVETNPRRTGGTHVYDLAKHLFGDSWEHDAYFLSHDSFQYSSEPMPVETLLERMRTVFYPIEGQRRGIIITFINPVEPIMGYVAIGGNADDGRGLQQQLFDLFKNA